MTKPIRMRSLSSGGPCPSTLLLQPRSHAASKVLDSDKAPAVALKQEDSD